MLYNHLNPINVPPARSENQHGTDLLEGQGVKVGILDTGVIETNPALVGRIYGYKNYVDDADTSTGDKIGHGTVIAQILGGTPDVAPDGQWTFPGGVAPQVQMYVARVIRDSSTSTAPNRIGEAVSDMVNAGIRLFNMSYGVDTTIDKFAGQQNDPTSAASITHSLYTPIIQHDGLAVFAAGNDGAAQPQLEGGLPSLFPDLKNNWITVVNVATDNNGHVIGLDKTSNACGVAEMWCLSAPGLAYVSPVPGTQFASGGADGTSNSAPQVTGVAAMVWQQFPWMSASNVQQTILGTANALGEQDIFGWGLLNAGGAVNGPGALNWGVFIANVPTGYTSTFNNVLMGTGGLDKEGGGTLILGGEILYNGATTVGGGVLQLSQWGGISNVTINSGGTLSVTVANVPITGNIVNSGKLSTGLGSLQVKGDYTATSTAITEITPYQILSVNGTASLDGTLSVTRGNRTYLSSEVDPLITGVLVQGQFASLTLDSVFSSGVLNYAPNNVFITLTRSSVPTVASVALPVSAVSAQETAQHVEQALHQLDGQVQAKPSESSAFLAAAGQFEYAPTIQAAARSITSLSGEIHASSQALNLQQANIVSRTIADRLADPLFTPGGAWVQATGADGNLATPGFAGASYSGGGAVAGVDTAVSESSAIGVAFSWNRMTSDYNGDIGRSTSRTSGISVYGRWGLGDAYLAGRIGQDWVRSTVDRTAYLGLDTQSIGTKRDDKLSSAYAEAGYAIKADHWTVTPFGSLGLNHLDRDGFTEQGAGGFGLTARSQTLDESIGQLGSRFGYSWSTSAGTTSLSGYALWQHLFGGRDLGLNASYVGEPTANFVVEGINPVKDSGWVGIGLTSSLGQHWSWWLNFDAQVAGKGNTARAATAGVKFNF
ncbi:serine protease [Dyella sp. GSA-30]|nr:serine protease [Dyella sp. GSA-30]